MLRNSLCEQSQFTHNFLFNSTIKSFNDIFPNIEFLLREKEIAPQTLQIHTLEKKIVAPPNFCTFRRACRIVSNVNLLKSNVLGSSSIWTFQILNIEYLLLFFCRQAQWKKSKHIFKMRPNR